MKVPVSENPPLSYPTPLDSRVDIDLLYAACPELQLLFAVCSVLSYMAAKASGVASERPEPAFP